VHSVMTVTPVNRQESAVRNFSGVVKENSTVSLSFRTPGQIRSILVKEGSHVKRGQLVATLDTKDYQLQVDAAQTQYNQMKNEVERLRQLHEGKSLTGNDYEKAVSGLEQLRIQLQNAKNQLSYTSLRAPVDGTIQKVNFEPSEMVNAGTQQPHRGKDPTENLRDGIPPCDRPSGINEVTPKVSANFWGHFIYCLLGCSSMLSVPSQASFR